MLFQSVSFDISNSSLRPLDASAAFSAVFNASSPYWLELIERDEHDMVELYGDRTGSWEHYEVSEYTVNASVQNGSLNLLGNLNYE